jgi:multiple sugar transport system substrate-binding protein
MINKFNKIIIWCLVILIGSIFISLPKVEASPKVTITFWHTMKGDKSDTLNKILEKFMEKNPDIRVKDELIVSKDPTMGNDYHVLYNRILESLALRKPPDVALVYENWTTQLVEVKALIPIQGFIGKPGGLSQNDINDFIPVFLQGNTFNNKLYTLPFNKSIYVLYYNKNLFKEKGLQPPKTWEELRETAKQLTIWEGGDIKTYGLVIEPTVDYFGHYLYAYGDDFIKGNKVGFDTETGFRSLEFFTNMINTDMSAKFAFRGSNEFIDGNAAMYIYTTSRISTFDEKIKNFEYGVAPLPSGTTKKYQFAGTNLAIFAHPGMSKAKQEAAFKLVKFLTSRSVTAYWSVKTGYLPVRLSAIKSKDYQEYLDRHPNRLVAIEELKYGKVQPKVAAWESIRGILDDCMFDAVTLRKTPKDALKEAVTKANELLANILK